MESRRSHSRPDRLPPWLKNCEVNLLERVRQFAAVVAVAAVLGRSASAADWPTYRHDNQRTGIAPEELRPPLHLRWTFESPFPPAMGWALPVNGYGARKNKPNVCYDDAFHVVAAGDTAYFCSSAENRLYAVDAATGKVRWTFFTDAAPRLAPTYWNGKLFLGADDGRVRCLDAEDGSLVWEFDAAPTRQKMLGQGRFSSLWPVRAGVMVDEGIAYFTAGLFPSEGVYFCALNASDGQVVWRKRLDHGGRGATPSPQGYPLATDDSLFLTSRVAPTRWRKEDGSQVGFATPFPEVKNAHEYRFLCGGTYAQVWDGRNLVFGQAGLLGYNPDTPFKDKYGKEHHGELLFNWFNARQAAFHGDLVYVATDYYAAAVEQSRLAELSQHELREFEEDVYKGLQIASYLDHLEDHAKLSAELGQDDPCVQWLKNGPLKWGRANWERWPAASQAAFGKIAKKCRWLVPLTATEAMILSGSILYLGGESAVYALDAATGKELWRANTDSPVRGLAVANGRLYVSTIDGAVRCFAKEATVPATVAGWSPDSLSEEQGGELFASIATEVLSALDTNSGYCLILGDGGGRLAREIAKRSALAVHVLEPDSAKVSAARERLSAAGLYGGRVCVEQSDLRALPFAPYLFNLVIDQSAFQGQRSPTPLSEIVRVTRPCGGVAFVGQPEGAVVLGERLNDASLREALGSLVDQNVEVESRGAWHRLTRGPLPGAKDWTHNYATAANTYCSEDKLVRGPFGILWYGEPGPRKRIERHANPPMPLVYDGIMFTLGYDLLMAYDAYNGIRHWERRLHGATRAGLPLGTSNMVVDRDGLFVVVGDTSCLRLDRRTGETTQTYSPPPRGGTDRSYWAWIAKEGPYLYGSRAQTDERRRRPDSAKSDGVFALDVGNGRLRWQYDGAGIDHNGIALSGGEVLFVQRELSQAERAEARRTRIRDDSVESRKPIDRQGKPIEPDLRKLVALDAKTGQLLWQKPFDVTDITLDDRVVSGGRVGVACMVKDGVLVVHGTGSLGHPHREFLRGEFKRRALYAFEASTGRFLWGGRKGYRKRPITIGGYVYAEPFAWHLKTGRQKTIANPLSGIEQPFDFHRGYIGCSHLLGSGAALFGNRNGIAYCSLDGTAGFASFANMTLGCGLCAVPANGVFVAPEGRSGCTCDTPIYTSLALYPRADGGSWSHGVAGGIGSTQVFPIQRVAINLGAPGFREDAEGNLWIPYPARTGTGILGDWLPQYQHDQSMCYRLDDLTETVTGTDRPWLFTSGYANAKPLRFRLVDEGEAPARFTVKLFFAEPEDLRVGQRVFSVLVQGETTFTDLDVVREAGRCRHALVREVTGVEVSDYLTIALTPSVAVNKKPPVLCAFQGVRE